MIGTHDFISSDLFGIVDRLKGIDEGYFVVYSYKNKRFEVHHNEQRGGSLAFVVPFPRLDARTLTLARESRRERRDAIIAKMESDNAKRERAMQKAAVERAVQNAENALMAL